MQKNITKKEIMNNILLCAKIDPKINEIVSANKGHLIWCTKSKLLETHFSLLNFLKIKDEHSFNIFTESFNEVISISREKKKIYNATPKNIKKRIEYSQTAEAKAKKKEYMQSPKGRAIQKAYEQSPRYKAIKKAYRNNPKNKAYMKAYHQNPEAKAKRKEYRERPEVKAKRRLNYKIKKIINNNLTEFMNVNNLNEKEILKSLKSEILIESAITRPLIELGISEIYISLYTTQVLAINNTQFTYPERLNLVETLKKDLHQNNSNLILNDVLTYIDLFYFYLANKIEFTQTNLFNDDTKQN